MSEAGLMKSGSRFSSEKCCAFLPSPPGWGGRGAGGEGDSVPRGDTVPIGDAEPPHPFPLPLITGGEGADSATIPNEHHVLETRKMSVVFISPGRGSCRAGHRGSAGASPASPSQLRTFPPPFIS